MSPHVETDGGVRPAIGGLGHPRRSRNGAADRPRASLPPPMSAGPRPPGVAGNPRSGSRRPPVEPSRSRGRPRSDAAVGVEGVEPPTSAMWWQRSTTELHASGRSPRRRHSTPTKLAESLTPPPQRRPSTPPLNAAPQRREGGTCRMHLAHTGARSVVAPASGARAVAGGVRRLGGCRDRARPRRAAPAPRECFVRPLSGEARDSLVLIGSKARRLARPVAAGLAPLSRPRPRKGESGARGEIEGNASKSTGGAPTRERADPATSPCRMKGPGTGARAGGGGGHRPIPRRAVSHPAARGGGNGRCRQSCASRRTPARSPTGAPPRRRARPVTARRSRATPARRAGRGRRAIAAGDPIDGEGRRSPKGKANEAGPDGLDAEGREAP